MDRAEGALRTDWRINNRYPSVDEHLALARDVNRLAAALREIDEMPSNATVYNAQFIAREALQGCVDDEGSAMNFTGEVGPKDCTCEFCAGYDRG